MAASRLHRAGSAAIRNAPTKLLHSALYVRHTAHIQCRRTKRRRKSDDGSCQPSRRCGPSPKGRSHFAKARAFERTAKHARRVRDTQSYILYGRSEGRRSSVYVPDALAQQVQTAIDNGRELQQLMSEAGVRYVNALKTARRKP